jgi:hypothetical protein
MIARAYRVADALRAAGIKVVMGGPHVTECPDEALGRDGGPRHADAVALVEADETWHLIVEDAAQGRLKEVYEPERDAKGLDKKPTLQPYPHIPWEKLPIEQFSLVPGFLKPLLSKLGGRELATKLYRTLEEHGIEYVADFPVTEVTAQEVKTLDGHILAYDLLMLLPPFTGVGPVIDTGITDSKNFIRVDDSMRVKDNERMYAVGDATNLRGVKTAHMSVRQAEVAAANVQAEIEGRKPSAKYEHEIRSIIDEGGRDSIYLHKKLWMDETGDVSQGRIWHWAKMVREKTWMLTHS